MKRSLVIVAVVVAVLAVLGIAAFVAFQSVDVRRGLVDALTPEYAPEGDASRLAPTFPAPDDSRERVDVGLTEVATDFALPVDIQFVPGHPSVMLVVEQAGGVVRVEGEARRELMKIDVVTGGERGLLGLAFHPDYAQNGRFFLNATVASGKREKTQISSWKVPPGDDLSTANPALERVIIEIEQPYQNHNGGQLAFGPDGMLYLGTGDGGFADDPHNHGQDRSTLLGAMLRLDVDKQADGKGYAVPTDNPFVGQDGVRPEIWAYGLRNPWRYAFSPDARLVVADVGQDLFEEVTIVGAGENHGWKVREAAHCFPEGATCSSKGLVDPIWEYPRQEGVSITGGYVYTGEALPKLRDHYIFGDFVSGRLWALALDGESVPKTLGKWPLLPSTFGQDASGELYVADYGRGAILRITTPAARP